MANLLSVNIALERILAQISQLSSEDIQLTNALGRVLAGDVVSDIDLPPFANSAMDGFAVRAEDVKHASQDSGETLLVIMDIPAGAVPNKTVKPGQCARIMTGAPMPDGADAVVPVEDTNVNWEQWDAAIPIDQVTIFKSVDVGAAVRPVGENIKQGERILDAKSVIRPQELGLLAALGHGVVSVVKQPRVVIISSGDELVSVDEPLTPGKIRDVNSHTLAGLVRQNGGEPIVLPPAKDTLDDVRALFDTAIGLAPDMIVSSAGASVGASDYIQVVLREKGQIDFWRINLRPGKPLSFGKLDDIPFFGLPGNPVSAMVTFDVVVRPALLKLGGFTDHTSIISARTGETFRSDGRRSYIRVALRKSEDGDWIATSTGTQSSGALISMVQADGLMIIPEDVKEVAAGTALDVRLLRPLS